MIDMNVIVAVVKKVVLINYQVKKATENTESVEL